MTGLLALMAPAFGCHPDAQGNDQGHTDEALALGSGSPNVRQMDMVLRASAAKLLPVATTDRDGAISAKIAAS